MAINLKYHAEINNIGCDLASFQPQNRAAYRWIAAEINDPDNFTPVYGLFDEAEVPRTDCRGWGLSLFDSEEAAQARISKIRRRKNRLSKKLTHIAEGHLEESDGISCEANPEGHFTHHECIGIDLFAKFTIFSTIVLP